jgi:hypothetical protein
MAGFDLEEPLEIQTIEEIPIEETPVEEPAKPKMPKKDSSKNLWMSLKKRLEGFMEDGIGKEQ